MVTEEDVREEARRILHNADLDKTSGRIIRTEIGQALGLNREELKQFRHSIEVCKVSLCLFYLVDTSAEMLSVKLSVDDALSQVQGRLLMKIKAC